MSYCGECYYEGKKLKPCSACWCGSEAKTEWTNADAIRSMTDEELADWLNSQYEYASIMGWQHDSALLEWLQSEAEWE